MGGFYLDGIKLKWIIGIHGNWKKWNTAHLCTEKLFWSYQQSYTLESGINIPPWINIAPGKFGKKNKRSPIYTLYFYNLNRLYEVQNKAVAPGKKSKN